MEVDSLEDNTISTGTLGLLTNNNSSSDSSFVPTMTICEGTSSKVKNRTTLGINTYSPNTNDYTLDINGKTRIGHGEIHVRAKPEFVVSSMSFSKDNLDYGMIVGTSLTNSDTSYNAFVTEDGGENWTMKEVVGDTTINANNDNVLTVHVSNTSNAYISVERQSQNDLILYSTDKGDNWTRILIVSAGTLDYNNIIGYFDTSHNIFVSSPNTNNVLYYYTVADNGNVFSNDVSGNYSTNHNIEHIVALDNNVVYSIGQHTTDTSGVIGKYIFDIDISGAGVATLMNNLLQDLVHSIAFTHMMKTMWLRLEMITLLILEMVEIVMVPDGIYFRILVLIYMMYIYQVLNMVLPLEQESLYIPTIIMLLGNKSRVIYLIGLV